MGVARWMGRPELGVSESDGARERSGVDSQVAFGAASGSEYAAAWRVLRGTATPDLVSSGSWPEWPDAADQQCAVLSVPGTA